VLDARWTRAGVLILLPLTFRITSFGVATLLDKLPNRLGRHRAGLPRHFAPGFEQCERGYRINAKPLRKDRQFFGIHLGHKPSAPTLGGDLDQFGRDHFARSAPRSPELDEHGERRVAGYGIEECFAFHLNRFAGRSEFGVTLAAAEDLPEPFVDQAITLAALWAGQQQAAVIGFDGGHGLVKELIEQFLLRDLGQVAREILLDTIADGRRKFIKNLLVDFLVCCSAICFS